MPTPSDPKQIFLDILELDAAEQAAYLDAACVGDPALRARVEALLAADEQAGPFLASPTGGAHGDSAPHEQPGTVIGHFKLQQEIGEGGFGTVWMAEQQQPVRRQVALKVVKRGMHTRSVVARFEQERQALAMMDHPNIAKVFDGGETPAGRPYFAMELVRGVPITTFCDQQHLDARERLALFVLVCQAVQHAHQKGIIHRDLKPSNVLVTLHDSVPVPKVIDFGVAKAVHRPLTEKTLFTEFRQMVGTPEYMSPEQAELSGLDIDTRADIYSLGVLLYELLTGTLPFDAGTLQQKGLLEMLRVIREDEPPKPSTRVSTPGASSMEVARSRRTDTRRLGKLLRGDLDWIVMKALEKDRARRYVSADALAADVQRHLRDEPVLASPPGRVYRLRKYVRRHRVGVSATALVAAALVVGLTGALWGLLDARAQRDVARKESTRANTVLGLLKDALTAADPHENKGKDYRVRELLDDFDRKQAAHLQGEPEVAATVHDLLGTAYLGLGLLDKAKPHIDATLELLRQQSGDESEAVARAMIVQASWLHDGGRFADAVPVIAKARRMLVATAGTGHPNVVECYAKLADYYSHLDRPELAEATMREALAEMDKVLAPDDTSRIDLLMYSAQIFTESPRFAEAIELGKKALELARRAVGEDRMKGEVPTDAGGNRAQIPLRTLAEINRLTGRLVEAEKLQRQSLEVTRASCGTFPISGCASLRPKPKRGVARVA